MRYLKLLPVLFMLLFSSGIQAMEIKGHIALEEGWQPVVLLASLNSPADLFVASPDFIIARSFIKADGTFEISTSDVPEDERFYRLYLVKGDNSLVEFNTADKRNFVHLLLNRSSSLNLDAEVRNNTLWVKSLQGDAAPENRRILAFDEEVSEKKQQLTGEITKVRRDFLTNELIVYIRKFVEEEDNTMVGLYALYQIDGKDTDFLRHPEFYFDFQERLENQYAGTAYAEAYADLLKDLVGFRDMVCEMPGIQPRWKDQLLLAQSIAIGVLLVALLWLILILRKRKPVNNSLSKLQDSYSNLTMKEKEILKLLADGKSNKEIAQELFVELSTVKTHINSIYKQLNLANRKEAIQFYQSLN